MKHNILIIIFLVLFRICSITAAGYESIYGFWRGAVERNGSVQIVEFMFIPKGDSAEGTYNIPEMGLFDEPVNEISLNDQALRFRFFMGYFDAYIDTETGEITGDNKKWDPPLRINLKKSLPDKQCFTKENITFNNKNILLKGTLYKPACADYFPAVLIVHGAEEPKSRRAWRYRYFAYLLAKNGIGSLIYDSRGVDSSSGNPDASIFELADDAVCGLNYLSVRSDVLKNKIGILGISRGGWTSAIAMNKTSAISFAVLFLGPSVSVWEQDQDAVRFSMKQDGFEIEQIDSALKHNKLYFECINDKSKWSSLERSVNNLKNRPWAKYIQTPRMYNDSDMIWWMKNKYDPIGDLSSSLVPVLSIFGENDPLVPPSENEYKMGQYLSKSGSKYEIIVAPQLPHNVHYNQFLKTGKWDWPGGYWVWPKRSVFLETKLVEWIKER